MRAGGNRSKSEHCDSGRASDCPDLRRSARPTYSDPEFDHGGAASAFVRRGLGDGGDMGMLLEELAKGLAEDAHAAAVHDADTGKSGEEGAIDELLDFAGGIVDRASDDVDFRGDTGGVGTEGDGDAAGAGSGDGGFRCPNNNFGDVVAG